MKVDIKPKLCRKCVNYLQWDKDNIECDFEYWKETKIQNTLLFTPNQFNCKHYEKKPE